MKYIVAALVLAQAAAFAPIAKPSSAALTQLFAEEYVPMEGEGKMNLKIDLDSPKVATMDEIEKGKKVYCRCWLSGSVAYRTSCDIR